MDIPVPEQPLSEKEQHFATMMKLIPLVKSPEAKKWLAIEAFEYLAQYFPNDLPLLWKSENFVKAIFLKICQWECGSAITEREVAARADVQKLKAMCQCRLVYLQLSK